MAKVANLKSSIQSKIQHDVTSMQQKTASSTQATQAGSTVTPEVTSTPKVTQTAKAMPSITQKPDITPVNISTVTQTPTPNVRDLLGTTSLRKAATPDLLSTSAERKDITKSALPTSLVRAANTQGGTAKEAVDKTLLEQFSYWFNEKPKEITEKAGSLFKKSAEDTWDVIGEPAKKFGVGFESLINDTEYYVAKLADVIETSMGGKGGFVDAFQEQQGKYWDIYTQENEVESAKLYDEDLKAQELSSNVSNWLYDKTGNEELSNMLGNVAGRVYANVKDPNQIAYTVGYMAPALILGGASGGGFWANTAIWAPSQSTLVYKDFAEDQELSSQFTDNQLFGISTGFGTVLAMVETFGDALGDMPWAKAMNRSIRKTFTKGLKEEITKGLSKDITNSIDKSLIESIRKPVLKALKNWFRGGFGEGLEEVAQESIQTEGAIALGSKREHLTPEQLLTIGGTAIGMGWAVQGPGVAINIKNNQDLKKEYDNFSKTIDKLSPGINEETKQAFFSAMITSQQNDAKLSEKRVEKYESQVTQLYNQISDLEQQLEATTDENSKTKINNQIDGLKNQIKEIDKKINQWNNTKEEINKYIEERNAKIEEEETQKELEELHAEVNQSIEGENLSEQTTKVPDGQGSVKVRQVAPGRGWDKKDMRKIFEKSVNDIKSGTYYGDTEFAGYAYYNTSTMTKDTKDVMKMRAKVEDLLRKIGVTIRYTSNPDRDMGPGLAGLYEHSRKRVTYNSGENGVQIYGHEVFHAIMDIIHNGKITDKELQKKLRDILDKAIDDVKKQFGIDIYKEGTEEFYIANTFAEEWLSNSFGEYLAKRELEGPKTFVQKIKEFFKQIISLFSKEGLTEMSLNKELREAFESIANGEVIKEKPASFHRRGLIGESLGGRAGFKIPTTTEGFLSLAEALKQPQNTILSTLTELKLKELKTKTQDMWRSEGFFGKNNEAYRLIIKKINDELSVRQEQEKESGAKKLTFKNAGDYIKKMIAIDKANGDWTRSNDKALRYKYMSNFLRTNLEGDFSAHLPGLKGVNLKQIEGKLSIKNLKDITEMLSLVSATLGIDFNKVIMDKYMSMNIADDIKDFKYHTDALGLMSRKATKDMIKELSEREGGYLPTTLGADIATMGVAITLQEGPMKSAATMAHELMHLIDFALSTEEGLPLYFEKGKVTYTSIIKDDSSWKTYTKSNYNKDYYNRWQEILARYAEQYFAYKNDKELFDKFTKRSWYWTEEEFLKLIPKFESFIKDRLGAKLLDEENQFYYNIVRKMNENKFATISTEFDREDLKEDDVKFKLTQLEEEYGFIMTHLNEMTGTLKEEMEAYVQLSNLQSNYEMAKAKGEEYLEKLKTTPEQQQTIDDITETVLPPEPVPGNPNPTPSNNPTIIRLGLPYFGGSNIEEGIGDIIKGGEGEKLGESYMKEEDIIKIRNRKNKIKGFFKECGQAFKDVFTPAISRIYNISPRVAGRLVTMETQKDINIYRYRQKAKGFVETLGGLKGNNALEVKMALLDYGALASEQGENIEQYKKDEVAKLKEVLLRNGFKEKDINDMFDVLNDIGRQYQDAGLKLVTTDLYFPRVVKDYEGLIDYMNRVSGKDIKVNKISLMMKIRNIQSDINLTDEEKEAKIRRAISIEFNQPGTTSQHGKERKMGKLSDWGEGIFAYYESPIESIDHYITTMVNAIQRQLFLGGMKEDADITEGDILNQSTAESVSTIIGKLVEQGKVSEDDIEELQKSILAVLNKKPSPKAVTALKNITYIATITNFISAINQLDDLGMVILKDKSGLKHIVKTIAGRAGIKYDDLGLEDAYEMFREEGGITNWLFKKSFFNMFDRLGKTSFIDTAWESMIHQSKNEKTRKYLYTRLQSMYGTESADRMMEKIDSNNYKDSDGQIDIEILRDLLYQLGSTQPIYTSSMPVVYLNHPWARLSYALSSFTLKRMDWLVQGFKEVNAKHGKVAAGAWVMSVSFFLAMFGAAIGDIGDLLKGKKEDTFLWNLINKGIDEALAAGGSDMLDSWLKIWDLSEYDLKTLDRQGMQGLIGSKISPFIFDLGKDVVEAVWEHDANQITDLAKYVPIFGKLTYYWFWDELESVTKPEEEEWDFSGEEEWDFSGEEEWDFSGEEEWDFS